MLARYLLVGGLGALVEMGLFGLLIRLGFGITLSNVLAFQAALTLCFALHYGYTYRMPASSGRALASYYFKFFALMYCQLLVSTLLLELLIGHWGWQPDLAKLTQIALVTPVSFFVQRTRIFAQGAAG